MNRKTLLYAAVLLLLTFLGWRLGQPIRPPAPDTAPRAAAAATPETPRVRQSAAPGSSVVAAGAVAVQPVVAAPAPAAPSAALVSPAGIPVIRRHVLPTAKGDQPIDFSTHYVLIGGHKAHPSRLLAKFSARAEEGALGGLLTREQFAAFASPLSPSGMLLLNSTDGQPTAVQSAAEARAKGEALAQRMKSLLASGQFDYVEPDYIVSANLAPTDTAFVNGTLWGLRNTGISGGVVGNDVDAVRAWEITTGSTNVIVAIIDTGIRYTHRDLAAQMWRNPGETAGNGVDDDGDGYVDNVFGINAITGSGDPLDDNNHGTHCAGTIGAAANDGNGHVGVAWNVRLMACKFLGADGSGALSHAIRCIDFAVAKRAKILSNSWGGGGYSQSLFDAIRNARDQGVIFIAAAGNESNNNDASPSYPASYELDNVVAVAAIDRTDKIAGFSNFGSRTVHLGAPGVAIFSSVSGSDTAYATFSGTSMACPHVAGVASLVMARFPDISLAELKQRLVNTVVPTEDLQGRTISGGRVNAFNALNASADGILEVALAASPVPLRAGQNGTFIVSVTDLSAVTNATVVGTIPGAVTNLAFANNGTPPDAAANDHFYTASAALPAGVTEVVLIASVSAPGKASVMVTNRFPVISPPANDAFASRARLDGNSPTASANNVAASKEAGEPDHAGDRGGRSVWWTWTASVAGTVTVRTAGSSFDTTLGVYTGTAVNALTLVADNDDFGGGQQSQVIFTATAGTTYQIAVDGYGGSAGAITLALTATGGAGPTPANDLFANRITIPGASNTVSGVSTDATKEAGEPNHAGFPGGRSVWWTWTAPDNGGYSVDTAGSAFDTLLGVYTGTAVGSLTVVASNDDAAGLQSRVTFTAVSGTAYHFAVDGKGGAFGAVQLTVRPLPVALPPVNDHFANRTALGSATSISLTDTNTLATREADEPDHAGNTGGRSLWWTWTAPISGVATLTTAGSAFDTLLAVYTGTAVGTLTEVVSNNNDPAGGTFSRVTFSVTAGQTFEIAVDGNNDGFSAASGVLVLALTLAPPVVTPVNDLFANRIALTGASNSVTGSNAGGTRETGEPNHAGVSGGHSVWWTWTAPASGPVTISTLGSGYDTTLAVYTGGAVNALTLVGANDDSASGLQSTVAFTAVADAVYQIAVDGFGDAVGAISLNVVQAAAPVVISLAAALDITDMVWNTGGNAPWIGQTNITHDGVDAGQSGAIGNRQSSYFETALTGPGTLTFWWRVSSESGYDFLRLRLDGSTQFAISGEVNWEQRTLTIPAGTHTLRWSYSKDEDVVDGQDRGWVDEVVFTPTGVAPPVITEPPLAQSAIEGSTVSFQVAATGADRHYQWRKDGVGLVAGGRVSGAAGVTLTLANVVTGDAGLYSVVVSNAGGSVTSSTAGLTIVGSVVLPLTNNVAVSNLAGALNSFTYFVIAVPPGQSNLTFTLAGGTGDCDLYVRYGALPTLTTWDFRPYLNGSDEAVSVTNPAAGNWFVLLHGYTAYADTSLLARFGGGSGYEGDVAGRPDGDGLVNLADWTQVGRFAAGLDTPASASEFQRADTAPRGTLGDGRISIIDWVQTGRYVFGLDPLTLVGGPVSTAGLLASARQPSTKDARLVRVAGGALLPGATNTVVVQLIAQGNENALGFSLNFNPALWTFLGAEAGTAAAGAQLHVNSNQIAGGQIGLAVARPVGSTFNAGVAEVARLTFAVAAETGASTVSFGDQPVPREIASAGAVELTDVTYEDGAFAPGIPAPVITSQPQSVVTNFGATVTFSVAATGPALGYQWRRNGLNLPGQTTNALILPNVNRSHGGAYSVLVSNGGGSVTSSNAFLRVRVPHRLEPPHRQPGGQFMLTFTDRDGGLLSVTNLTTIEVQMSTNLIVWKAVTNGVTVTNGLVVVAEPDSAGAVRRFYRVIER